MPFFKDKRFALTETQIRQENPQVSFGAGFNPAELGYTFYWDSPRPTVDLLRFTVAEIFPAFDGSKFVQQWQVTALSPEQIAANLARAQDEFVASAAAQTQERLDAFARSRNYDNVNSIAKYKDISDAEIAALPPEVQPYAQKFREESRYLAAKAAETWARLYLLQAEVLSGARPQPASFAEIEAELPVLSWPV